MPCDSTCKCQLLDSDLNWLHRAHLLHDFGQFRRVSPGHSPFKGKIFPCCFGHILYDVLAGVSSCAENNDIIGLHDVKAIWQILLTALKNSLPPDILASC